MVLDRTVDELVSQAADVTAELEAQTRALLETWDWARATLEQDGGTDDHR